MQTCPVPEIEKALFPYIHNRQDALKIRSALAKYFYTNFGPNDAPLQDQHLHRLYPQEIPKTRSDVSTPDGLRHEYLKALQQKIHAQEKYRKQHTLLENQRHNDAVEVATQVDSTYDIENVRDYVSLLRQRRRLAELQVIHDSLEKIMDLDPTTSHRDPRELVQEAIGEQPGLPAEQLEPKPQVQKDNGWFQRLKKEVLVSKSNMDQANVEKSKAKALFEQITDLSNQVHALGRARDEMVSWVEEELLKLNEESEFLDDLSPKKANPLAAAVDPPDSSEQAIHHVYQQYTASRTSIIGLETSLTREVAPPSSLEGSGSQKDENSSPPRPIKPVVDNFPHVTRLLQISNDERGLLQHAIYMQTKFTSTDGELRDALSKLSEESHLLPSGSQSPLVWATAASEAEITTNDLVRDHLQESVRNLVALDAVVNTSSLRTQILGLAKNRE